MLDRTRINVGEYNATPGKCFHSVMKHKVGICTMTNQLMLDGISIIMHLERSSKSVQKSKKIIRRREMESGPHTLGKTVFSVQMST